MGSRLSSASHKKYHHAATFKWLEPGDDFRHHVGVVRPLQVGDAVSYCQFETTDEATWFTPCGRLSHVAPPPPSSPPTRVHVTFVVVLARRRRRRDAGAPREGCTHRRPPPRVRWHRIAHMRPSSSFSTTITAFSSFVLPHRPPWRPFAPSPPRRRRRHRRRRSSSIIASSSSFLLPPSTTYSRTAVVRRRIGHL